MSDIQTTRGERPAIALAPRWTRVSRRLVSIQRDRREARKQAGNDA